MSYTAMKPKRVTVVLGSTVGFATSPSEKGVCMGGGGQTESAAVV